MYTGSMCYGASAQLHEAIRQAGVYRNFSSTKKMPSNRWEKHVDVSSHLDASLSQELPRLPLQQQWISLAQQNIHTWASACPAPATASLLIPAGVAHGAGTVADHLAKSVHTNVSQHGDIKIATVHNMHELAMHPRMASCSAAWTTGMHGCRQLAKPGHHL